MRATLAAVALLALFLTACASLEQTAFRTIGTVATVVDGSMKGWGDYVRAGKASAGDEAAVKAAYARYQLSMQAANVTIMQVKSGAATEDKLELTLRVVEGAAGELQLLIESLKKK